MVGGHSWDSGLLQQPYVCPGGKLECAHEQNPFSMDQRHLGKRWAAWQGSPGITGLLSWEKDYIFLSGHKLSLDTTLLSQAIPSICVYKPSPITAPPAVKPTVLCTATRYLRAPSGGQKPSSLSHGCFPTQVGSWRLFFRAATVNCKGCTDFKPSRLVEGSWKRDPVILYHSSPLAGVYLLKDIYRVKIQHFYTQ